MKRLVQTRCGSLIDITTYQRVFYFSTRHSEFSSTIAFYFCSFAGVDQIQVNELVAGWAIHFVDGLEFSAACEKKHGILFLHQEKGNLEIDFDFAASVWKKRQVLKRPL